MRQPTLWIVIAAAVVALIVVWLAATGDRVSPGGPVPRHETGSHAPPAPDSRSAANAPAIQGEKFQETPESAPESAPESRDAIALRHELRGVVVDPLSQPVPEARIEIVHCDSRGFGILDPGYRHLERRIGEVTTDAEGRFRFGVASGRAYDVAAIKDGYARTIVRDCRAGETVTIRLAPGGSLRGIVTRASDASPVPGARVKVWRDIDQAPLCEGTTDAGGRYELRALAPGPVTVELIPLVERMEPWRFLEIEAGKALENDYVLEAGATVTGRVVDAISRQPVADAEVGDGWKFSRSVRSGPDGTYALPGLGAEGEDEIFARARGYGGMKKKLPTPVPPGFVVDFALKAGRVVKGRVIASDGAPVPDVYVAAAAGAWNENGQELDWPSARSGADGRFLLADLRSDLRHALWFRKEGMGSAFYDLPPREDVEDTIDVGDVVLVRGGSIAGVVVDTSGRVQPSAKLALNGSNADRFKLWATGVETRRAVEGWVTARRGAADDQGRFRFDDVAPGEYRVSRAQDRRIGHPEVVVRVSAGEAVENVRLVIPAELAIKGRVECPDGSPVTLSIVTAYPETNVDGPAGETALTLARGAFTIGRLKAGTYTLVVRVLDDGDLAKGAAPAKIVGITAGTEDLRIVLPRSAPITGIVFDSDGKPVRDALISAADAAGTDLTETQAGTDGSFSIGVSEGEVVTLKAMTPYPLERAPGMAPKTFSDPSVEARAVRAGTKSLVLTLPAAK